MTRREKEIEQALLGAMMAGPEPVWEAAALVSPEDFAGDDHRTIYEALIDLTNAGEPIRSDFPRLHRYLEDRDSPIGLTLLSEIAADGGSPVAIRSYAQEVAAEGRTRRLRTSVLSMGDRLSSASIRATDAIPELQATLLELQGQDVKDPDTAQQMADTLIAHIQTLRANNGQLAGLDTGFPSLNQITGGLYRGNLFILASRPSIGKTAFGLSLALNAARKGSKTLIFSLEMTSEELQQRLTSIEAYVPLEAIRTGRGPDGPLTATDEEECAKAAAKLSSYPYLVADTPHVSPSQIRAQLHRTAARFGGLDLVVVDYVGLMAADHRGMDDYERVSSASRMLKSMAMEFEVPILCMSQLNRECEKRSDKKPQLSDLRESGSLEQDADLVGLLYRPGFYGLKGPNGESLANQASLIIAKHRHGPTGVVPLEWRAAMAHYRE